MIRISHFRVFNLNHLSYICFRDVNHQLQKFPSKVYGAIDLHVNFRKNDYVLPLPKINIGHFLKKFLSFSKKFFP